MKSLDYENRFEVDVCVITETKKELQGNKDIQNYTLFYSGVPQNKRASSGVAVLLKQRWKTIYVAIHL
jgi:hypothetical protein